MSSMINACLKKKKLNATFVALIPKIVEALGSEVV